MRKIAVGKWMLLYTPGHILGCRGSAVFHLVFCAFPEHLGTCPVLVGQHLHWLSCQEAWGCSVEIAKAWAVSPHVCLEQFQLCYSVATLSKRNQLCVNT